MCELIYNLKVPVIAFGFIFGFAISKTVALNEVLK